MHGVFISFIEEERRVALALRRILQQALAQCEVFVTADHWQMSPGERWLDRIETELRSAKVVIVILSRRSVMRPWINFEAGAAWLNRARLIPACIGGISGKDLPKPYNDLHAVRLDNCDEIDALIRSTSDVLEHAFPPIPFSPLGDDPALKELRDALDSLGEVLSVESDTQLSLEAVARAANNQAGLTNSDQATATILSDRARTFLQEAAKTNSGQINRVVLDQALVIQVNGQSFEAKLNEGRLRAELEDAMTELEESNLIKDVTGKRRLFQLTSRGYRIAKHIEV